MLKPIWSFQAALLSYWCSAHHPAVVCCYPVTRTKFCTEWRWMLITGLTHMNTEQAVNHNQGEGWRSDNENKISHCIVCCPNSGTPAEFHSWVVHKKNHQICQNSCFWSGDIGCSSAWPVRPALRRSPILSPGDSWVEAGTKSLRAKVL